MIIAHLPSGYLLGRAVQTRSAAAWLMPAAVIGGIFPDLDMFWFYLVDNQAVHHHRYWVHIPAFWLIVAALTLPLIAWGQKRLLPAALTFYAAIFMHLCLDSVVGDILWLYPFSNKMFALATVPASQPHWILSFLFHWSFALELAIWAAAIWAWRRR